MGSKFNCYAVIVLGALCVAFVSCRNSKAPESRHHVADEVAVKDSSLLARLDMVDDEKISVTLIDGGQHRQYRYAKALAGGHVKGDLNKGDTLSVFPDVQSGEVRSLVNVSQLVGQWFFDMEQHRGMRIGHGGALSSINMENVSFRNWFVKNGVFIIHYVDMQQRASDLREFWVDHSEIESLGKDELKLRFRDTLLQCRHQVGTIKLKF